MVYFLDDLQIHSIITSLTIGKMYNYVSHINRGMDMVLTTNKHEKREKNVGYVICRSKLLSNITHMAIFCVLENNFPSFVSTKCLRNVTALHLLFMYCCIHYFEPETTQRYSFFHVPVIYCLQ